MMTRKEAIQILSTRDAHGVLCGYTSGVTEALDMAIEALNNSIQMSNIQQLEAENGVLKEMVKFYREKQTKSKGEWIKNDDFTCSECGYHMIVGDGAYNFCPNCGADNRGDTK